MADVGHRRSESVLIPLEFRPISQLMNMPIYFTHDMRRLCHPCDAWSSKTRAMCVD